MKEFKESMIWSIINGKFHPSLTEKEIQEFGFMPIMACLFPGIKFHAMLEIIQALDGFARPLLTKQFPRLATLSEDHVRINVTVKINAFLKSNGHEWHDKRGWQLKFWTLLGKVKPITRKKQN